MRPRGVAVLTLTRPWRLLLPAGRIGRAALLGLVTLALTVTLVSAFGLRALQTHAATQHALYATAVAGSSYGADRYSMQAAATAAQWPQQNKLWCGVATVAAIAQYMKVTSATQSSVASYLSSPASASIWKTPGQAAGYWGPGFTADISRDFGTDPRALAAALHNATGKSYHQVIDLSNSYEASVTLADDIVNSGQPVSVFVDHGLHSVVVSSVFATDNPVTDPASITGFEVWDPAWNILSTGIQPYEWVDISLNTWITSTVYWGRSYNVNYDPTDGYTYDPNPAVGPYAYSAPSLGLGASLWAGHYVYIRPDASGSAASGVSPDWAFNQNGELVKGFDNTIPAGYTGPTSIFEGAKVTLNETSPYGIAFSARGSYDAAAPGSAPATALAWTGTDTRHHLNTLISQDGLHYGSKLTLSETSNLNPALLVAPPPGGGSTNVVVIAWIGTDGGHSINVLYDVYGAYGAPRKLTLWGNSSALTPALAWYQGQVWLAWTGTNGGHNLNVIPMGAQGVTPGGQTILWGEAGATSGPALTTDTTNHRMLLSASRLYSNNAMYLVSSDGANWSLPPNNQPGNVTYGAPAMLALPTTQNQFPSRYMVVAAPWSQLYIVRTNSDQGWDGTEAVSELSPYAPSVGYLGQGGNFIMAWSGTDSLHHLNVALIQM